MYENKADFWAAQERSVRIPSPKPDYAIRWEQNPLRWQNTEDEVRQPAALETLFDEQVVTGLPTKLEVIQGEMITTQYFVAMMKRCWLAWMQDGNPNAPMFIDRADWLELSEAELASETKKAQMVFQAVQTYMLENDLPIFRPLDSEEIYSPSKDSYES